MKTVEPLRILRLAREDLRKEPGESARRPAEVSHCWFRLVPSGERRKVNLLESLCVPEDKAAVAVAMKVSLTTQDHMRAEGGARELQPCGDPNVFGEGRLLLVRELHCLPTVGSEDQVNRGRISAP